MFSLCSYCSEEATISTVRYMIGASLVKGLTNGAFDFPMPASCLNQKVSGTHRDFTFSHLN